MRKSQKMKKAFLRELPKFARKGMSVGKLAGPWHLALADLWWRAGVFEHQT
jgi:hypothetical protein